jgi:uncharacterized membrane protein (DUF4010 family)
VENILDVLKPFIVAAIIGLIIGIERERSQYPHTVTMGVRTFTLLALLGTLAHWTSSNVISIVIAVFSFSAVLIGYYRSTQIKVKDAHEIGLTTEISAGFVFCLGYITPQTPLLAAILACFLLVLLTSRETLHRFARQTLKPDEIRAAMVILIILFGILPFLPRQPVDPWGLFNLYKIGTIVLIISLLQFTGYIAIRVFGHRLGIPLVGLFGGFASSTLVFL